MHIHEKANNPRQKAKYDQGCDNSRHDLMIQLEKMVTISLRKDKSTKNYVKGKYESGIVYMQGYKNFHYAVCRIYENNDPRILQPQQNFAAFVDGNYCLQKYYDD